jgi:hypothetical protein
MLMLYLARKTYVTRASVYGIISALFVIGEGLFIGRYIRVDDHKWYISAFTMVEIVLFLSGYTMIFFERVTVKNQAKFQKINKTVRYIKEVEDRDQKYDAVDYREETDASHTEDMHGETMVQGGNRTANIIMEDYIKRPNTINHSMAHENDDD